MHVNIVLGACVAGLQLAAANVPQYLGSRHIKTKWVTKSITVEGRPSFPTDWPDGWSSDGWPHHGKENHDKSSHRSSRDSKDHKDSKYHEQKK